MGVEWGEWRWWGGVKWGWSGGGMWVEWGGVGVEWGGVGWSGGMEGVGWNRIGCYRLSGWN